MFYIISKQRLNASLLELGQVRVLGRDDFVVKAKEGERESDASEAR